MDNSQVTYYTAEMVFEHREKDCNTLYIDKFKPLSFAQSWPFEISKIYRNEIEAGILFHGSFFQVITALGKMDKTGGTATLSGLQTLYWPDQPWATDAAMIDGVLQLLILWYFSHFHEKILPTAIGTYIPYTAQLPQGLLQCVVFCRPRAPHGLSADALLLQENGSVYAQLKNIEMFVASIKDL